MSSQIARGVAQVRERIATASRRAGCQPSEVTVVAVSKTRTPAEIEAAYLAGVRHFGENRVEEAEHKLPHIDVPGITWHMVGHLQSRKARRALDCFQILHSLDSVKLARKLDRLAGESGKALPVLIEVNVSGEQTKYGFRLDDRPTLEAAVADILALPNLRVEGLMTVAFVAQDPERVRPVFAELRALRDTFRARFPQSEWPHLSMGMSDDYPQAVEEGATIVRIGRAIFGPRTEE